MGKKLFADLDNDGNIIATESSNNGIMYFTKQLHEYLVVPARCGKRPELYVNTQLELWESILNQDMKLILS